MILADNLKTKLIRNLSNLPGWRTNRKIIVFESDDWGSVRMPSLTAFQYLESKGLDLSGGDAYRYNQNDTVESSVDLEALFNVICPYKDQRNKPFVIIFPLISAKRFAQLQKSIMEIQNHFLFGKKVLKTKCSYPSFMHASI